MKTRLHKSVRVSFDAGPSWWLKSHDRRIFGTQLNIQEHHVFDMIDLSDISTSGAHIWRPSVRIIFANICFIFLILSIRFLARRNYDTHQNLWLDLKEIGVHFVAGSILFRRGGKNIEDTTFSSLERLFCLYRQMKGKSDPWSSLSPTIAAKKTETFIAAFRFSLCRHFGQKINQPVKLNFGQLKGHFDEEAVKWYTKSRTPSFFLWEKERKNILVESYIGIYVGY